MHQVVYIQVLLLRSVIPWLDVIFFVVKVILQVKLRLNIGINIEEAEQNQSIDSDEVDSGCVDSDKKEEPLI